MGDRKTINLNPEFFAISGASKQKAKKSKPQNVAINNTVQEKLIDKVQEYQRKRERNLLKGTSSAPGQAPTRVPAQVELKPALNRSMPNPKERLESEFQSEFDKSLHFLQQLSLKQKKQPTNMHNGTLKRGKIEQRIHLEVATDLPPELQPKPGLTLAMPHKAAPVSAPMKTQITLTPASPIINAPSVATAPVVSAAPTVDNYSSPAVRPNPPFGILKNGSKPTFRAFHGLTYKHRPKAASAQPAMAPMNARQAALQAAKTAYQQAKKPKGPVPVKKRITKTVKFLLGKHKNRTVSVLVGHAEHKNNVQKERMLLRDTPIHDVKAYLRKHNLIKAGAILPHDVLRAMYESALLAGDVRNMTQQTRLHNFLHDTT